MRKIYRGLIKQKRKRRTLSVHPNFIFDQMGILGQLKTNGGCAKYKGVNVRYLETSGIFQVGTDDFDRWANSVSLEFEVWQRKGQRALMNWAGINDE